MNTGDESLRAGFEAFLLKQYGSVLQDILLVSGTL
jgi:hypothetical protein